MQDVCSEKNGDSFQVPWYIEVQKIGPETRNEVLKRLKRLSCKTVTDVSPKKNFGRAFGRIGLFGNGKTDNPQKQGSTPVLTEKNCPNQQNVSRSITLLIPAGIGTTVVM